MFGYSMKRFLLRTGRWIAVSTVGFVMLVVGVVMLFTPGPGLLMITGGLVVLSVEFRWARRQRDRLFGRVRNLGSRARLRRLQRRVDADPYLERSDGEQDTAA